MSDIAKIIALGGGTGGGGGTGDHRDLTHRDAADQHPMNAITGLLVALASKYQRPALGIPKSDLEDSVRISLGRADTALQTAPVASVNGKTGAVNLVPADLGIGSVFNLKGSKPTYADLPATGNTIGDVWYVVADSVGYIWLNDGTVDRWEQLGMEIDLSAYRTASAQDAIDSGFVKLVGTAGQTIQTNVAVPLNVKNNIALQHRAFMGFQTHDDNAIGFIGVDSGKPTFLAADGVTAKALQGETITDTAGYFTTDTVEGALAEIGGTLDGLEAAINTIRGVS